MRYPRLPGFTIEGMCFLLLLGVLLASAVMRQYNLLLLLFAMMACLPLLNWRLVRATLHRLEVERRLPKSVAAGDLLMVEIEATNRRRRLASWALRIEDQIVRQGIPLPGGPIRASTLLPCVLPEQSAKQSYRGRIMRRGRYTFGPLRISTRFPFGLIRSALTIEKPQTLLVSPRLGRLTRRWQRAQQSSELGTSNVERRQGLLEGEFYGLREWRQGDSHRWIHWRTTARRQTPIVRQFEQQRNQNLALILELWRPEQPRPADDDNVELAVSFAASIVADLCRRGSRTLWVAVAAAEPKSDSGPASLALSREVMESLAVAEATANDSLPQVLSQTLEAIRPGTAVLVISTRRVDNLDSRRFATLWSNPRHRAWISRMQSIDVNQPDLADYFIPQ